MFRASGFFVLMRITKFPLTLKNRQRGSVHPPLSCQNRRMQSARKLRRSSSSGLSGLSTPRFDSAVPIAPIDFLSLAADPTPGADLSAPAGTVAQVPVTPGSFTPLEEAALLRKATWRLIPYIGWLYLLSFMDRVNLANVHGTILTDLRLSETDYSTAVGIFFVVYICFELPSNIVMTKVQPRVWIARILITWGIITCCLAAVTDKTSVLLFCT